MSNTHSTLTQAIVKELLDYDPETGVLTWKPRAYDKRWTVRYSGKSAGMVKRVKNKFYQEVRVCHHLYKAHRIVWLHQYGELPKNEIDHINGNGLDNRIVNLRDVTTAENAKNQRKYKNNSSGVTGVVWVKAESKWEARINVAKKRICLGQFLSIFDAICSRKSAEREYLFHPNHGKLPHPSTFICHAKI